MKLEKQKKKQVVGSITLEQVKKAITVTNMSDELYKAFQSADIAQIPTSENTKMYTAMICKPEFCVIKGRVRNYGMLLRLFFWLRVLQELIPDMLVKHEVVQHDDDLYLKMERIGKAHEEQASSTEKRNVVSRTACGIVQLVSVVPNSKQNKFQNEARMKALFPNLCKMMLARAILSIGDSHLANVIADEQLQRIYCIDMEEQRNMEKKKFADIMQLMFAMKPCKPTCDKFNAWLQEEDIRSEVTKWLAHAKQVIQQDKWQQEAKKHHYEFDVTKCNRIMQKIETMLK